MSTKNKGSFGIYFIQTEGRFELIQDGFNNALECERWIKKNVSDLCEKEYSNTGDYAILSLKKKFSLKVETKKTVYIQPPRNQEGSGTDE